MFVKIVGLRSTHNASGGPAARLEKREGRGHLALRQGTLSPAPLEWISALTTLTQVLLNGSM